MLYRLKKKIQIQVLDLVVQIDTVDTEYNSCSTDTVSRPTPLRRRGLPLQIAGVDFRLKIHIRFCRAYA